MVVKYDKVAHGEDRRSLKIKFGEKYMSRGYGSEDRLRYSDQVSTGLEVGREKATKG